MGAAVEVRDEQHGQHEHLHDAGQQFRHGKILDGLLVSAFELVEGHDRVGILFDTFHANIEEKSIGPALERAGKLLRHVHACENDRGIAGSGHVEWTDVFAALDRIGYGRWMVIESFGSRIPEIAKAACIWRDLAPSSEAIAFEGLAFLKGKRGAR